MKPDLRYVYSPTYTSYATKRIIKDGKITPEKQGGSAIVYETLMDTGVPYPSIETLEEERYRYHEFVTSEYAGFLSSGSGVWLHADGGYSTWSAMEHEITFSGTHYIVEWMSKSEKGGFHKGDAYSKLYPTFQEAINQLQLHLQQKIGDRPEELYELDINKDKTHYRVHYKRFMEGFTSPGLTFLSMDTSDTIDDYRIIPITITEELYNNAQTEPNNTVALEFPRIR